MVGYDEEPTQNLQKSGKQESLQEGTRRLYTDLQYEDEEDFMNPPPLGDRRKRLLQEMLNMPLFRMYQNKQYYLMYRPIASADLLF